MKLLKVIITLYFGPESHQRIIHTRGSTKELFPFETSDFHSSSVCRIFSSSMSSINTPTPIIITEPVLFVRHVAHPVDHIVNPLYSRQEQGSQKSFTTFFTLFSKYSQCPSGFHTITIASLRFHQPDIIVASDFQELSFFFSTQTR